MSHVIAQGRNRSRRARRRRAIAVRLSFAGLAVTGVGAAVTAAAWTTNVTFASKAQAATVGLRAKIDGTDTWTDATADGVTVSIPDTAFADMVPGRDYTVTIDLENQGDTPLDLTGGEPTISADTGLFGRADDDSSDTEPKLGFSSGVLDAGSRTTATVSVTTPPDWSASHQGKTAQVEVTFTSTTDLPDAGGEK